MRVVFFPHTVPTALIDLPLHALSTHPYDSPNIEGVTSHLENRKDPRGRRLRRLHRPGQHQGMPQEKTKRVS